MNCIVVDYIPQQWDREESNHVLLKTRKTTKADTSRLPSKYSPSYWLHFRLPIALHNWGNTQWTQQVRQTDFGQQDFHTTLGEWGKFTVSALDAAQPIAPHKEQVLQTWKTDKRWAVEKRPREMKYFLTEDDVKDITECKFLGTALDLYHSLHFQNMTQKMMRVCHLHSNAIHRKEAPSGCNSKQPVVDLHLWWTPTAHPAQEVTSDYHMVLSGFSICESRVGHQCR